MIIHVNQTKTGAQIEYTFSGTNEKFTAKAPAFRETGYIQLRESQSSLWVLKYKVPKLIGKPTSLGVPFGVKHRINEFQIIQNDKEKGMMSKLRYDKVKTRYDVSIGKSNFYMYPLFQGKDEFLLVFKDNIQIAHIKRNTTTKNLKDHYVIYLLDKFSGYTVPLLLFVLYYDHSEHGNRGQYSKNSMQKSYGYSFGEANLLYDSNWLKVNFPQESINPVKVDIEKSKALSKRLSITQLLIAVIFFVALILFSIYIIGDPIVSIVCILLMVVFNMIKNRYTMR